MKNCYQITHFSGRPTWKSAGGNAWHSCPESTPHECAVPNCPGDLNRRKLEIFEEIVECLGECRHTLFDLGKLSWVRQGKPIGRRIDAALKAAKALK